MVIKPALAAAAAPVKAGAVPVRSAMTWLIILTMANAAVSAAYYLRIVATMFLRTSESAQPPAAHPAPIFARPALPVFLAVLLSVAGVALLGAVPAATELLGAGVKRAAAIENDLPRLQPPQGTTPVVSR
jgi:NADH:ubiquinone oxidoreductase subunit 5 (subunit L)/multisubunit Na+/H+ antiporter MnhA subunit